MARGNRPHFLIEKSKKMKRIIEKSKGEKILLFDVFSCELAKESLEDIRGGISCVGYKWCVTASTRSKRNRCGSYTGSDRKENMYWNIFDKLL